MMNPTTQPDQPAVTSAVTVAATGAGENRHHESPLRTTWVYLGIHLLVALPVLLLSLLAYDLIVDRQTGSIFPQTFDRLIAAMLLSGLAGGLGGFVMGSHIVHRFPHIPKSFIGRMTIIWGMALSAAFAMAYLLSIRMVDSVELATTLMGAVVLTGQIAFLIQIMEASAFADVTWGSLVIILSSLASFILVIFDGFRFLVGFPFLLLLNSLGLWVNLQPEYAPITCGIQMVAVGFGFGLLACLWINEWQPLPDGRSQKG
jgi:uncharacterized membrane protein (DUF485 family)